MTRRTPRIIHFLLTEMVEYLVVSLLLVMTTLVLAQVIWRYVLGNPLSWSEELARYSIIWLTFLGASLGVRHRTHITIEAGVQRLPGAWQRRVRLAGDLLVLLFLAVLVWQGSRVASVTMIFRSSGLDLPQGYIFLVVPLGAAIMGYHKLVQVLRLGRDHS